MGQPPTRLGETSTKKSYAQKLKFWGARRPGQPNNYWLSMWLPIALLQFPVVVFSGVLVGSVLSWFNVVNGTAALGLAAPPYNFSTEMIGVMFIAPFIGCTVGCAFAGVSANRFAVWMSRCKGGIFEPEYRLWMAVVPLLLHPAGCILFGVGANHGVHWMGLAFGLAFVVGTFPIGSAIAFNGMFFWALSFLFIVIGKKTRKTTARSYWHMVEKHGLKSHRAGRGQNSG